MEKGDSVMVKPMNAFGEVTSDFLGKEGIKTPAFGIDLGTTNSCISVVQAGNVPRVIELNNGAKTLPSVIMWKGKKGEFVVGKEAYVNRYKQSAVYSVKRKMGSGESVTLKYGTKELVMTPAEVSAEILKELVKQASVQYKDVKDVVITVPAYFDNKQITDTKLAAELAGLSLLGILREPTAATLVYDVGSEQEEAEQTILAYDLGGGTFDASLLRISISSGLGDELADLYGIEVEDGDDSVFSKKYSVLDTSGDSKLGGDDIDLELYKILEGKLRSRGVNTDLIPRQEKEKLILRMEKIKLQGVGHSYGVKMKFPLKSGAGVLEEQVDIQPSDIRAATEVVYLKTKKLVDEVLNRTDKSRIDAIVLVGGSTKSEVIKEFLRKDFPGVQINSALNPDESVAMGAAIKAKETKFGDTNIEVFDVIPQNIGVISDGHVSTVIKKNQRVPHTDRRMYTTKYDNQEVVQIEVYEGLSVLKEECLYLGSIVVDNLPKKEAGKVPVYIVMAIDTDGLLKVSVETPNGIKEVELVNLFGKTAEKKELTAEERRIIKWTSFAQRLESEAKQEVLQAVNQYKDGNITLRDVSIVIAKYSGKAVKIVEPTRVQHEEYGIGE
jgi:molecular chaperone DnaK